MEKVTISRKIYDTILYESVLLNCLLALGVDEWEGYSNAVAMALEEFQEEK